MRPRLLLGAIVLIGATYFAVFGGDYDLFDVHRIRRERAAEERRVAEAQEEVERLTARRDSLLRDDATVERIARERYGMIRDGERLYRFTEPPRDSLAGTAAAGADGPRR